MGSILLLIGLCRCVGDGVHPTSQAVVLVIAVLGCLFAGTPGGDQSAQGIPGIGGGLVGDAVVDAVQSAVTGIGVGQAASDA